LNVGIKQHSLTPFLQQKVITSRSTFHQIHKKIWPGMQYL